MQNAVYCVMKPGNHKKCRWCRLQKCYAAGMNINSVRTAKIPNTITQPQLPNVPENLTLQNPIMATQDPILPTQYRSILPRQNPIVPTQNPILSTQILPPPTSTYEVNMANELQPNRNVVAFLLHCSPATTNDPVQATSLSAIPQGNYTHVPEQPETLTIQTEELEVPVEKLEVPLEELEVLDGEHFSDIPEQSENATEISEKEKVLEEPISAGISNEGNVKENAKENAKETVKAVIANEEAKPDIAIEEVLMRTGAHSEVQSEDQAEVESEKNSRQHPETQVISPILSTDKTEKNATIESAQNPKNISDCSSGQS